MDISIPRGLPARQAQFLCLLAARPSLRRVDYQRLIAVSHHTAKRDLAELAEAHLIVPLGSTRNRRYALNPTACLRTQPTQADNGSDLAPTWPGSSGSNPDLIRITIDPLSIHRRPRRT